MKAVPACRGLVAGLRMLLSLSGVHVLICSGYDWVSHMAMPNQSAPLSSKENALFTLFGLLAGGSTGSVTL